MLAISSSSNSPCAACKFLRRKCTPECIFAPYFPPDYPQKFANVHKVFGASNVSKILNELHPSQREDAVNSLAYEAEARLSDPVYGCVGIISLLQYQLKQLQADLAVARSELSRYVSSAGLTGSLPPSFFQAMAISAQQQQHHHCQQHQNALASESVGRVGLSSAPSSTALYREQQTLEPQQIAAATAAAMIAAKQQQEILMRNYHLQNFTVLQNSEYDSGGGGVGFTNFALSSPSYSECVNPLQDQVLPRTVSRRKETDSDQDTGYSHHH